MGGDETDGLKSKPDNLLYKLYMEFWRILAVGLHVNALLTGACLGSFLELGLTHVCQRTDLEDVFAIAPLLSAICGLCRRGSSGCQGVAFNI